MAAKKNGYWNRRVERRKKSVGKEPNWNSWFADMEDTLPNLRQFLIGMPVGVERIEGGSVLVFSDHETPKMRLSDRHHGEVCFLTGDTLDGLLRTAEGRMADDSIVWRPDPYFQQKGKKR